MDSFNSKSRTNNALKSIGSGGINQIVNLILGFVYRTVFLMILSEQYLGLNGLFTNILNVLSLAELGIGAAIVYRMYQPISMDDIGKVANILSYYKRMYRFIAMIIAIIGLAIIPFLKFFIKDLTEVPADINIYIIYALFLFQTLSSYFFIYKTSIFNADQKGYIMSTANIIYNIVGTSARLLVLYLTKNFMLTLVVSIAINLIFNIIMSTIATKRYSFVFKIKGKLDKETIALIKKDTYAMACHKIGGVVVGSTDSILLSAFVGIGLLGIYSNYSLIIVSLAGLFAQLFGTFYSSIGNAKLKLDEENYYNVYKRLMFLNLWIVSCSSIALICLINPFITVWLGEKMLLGSDVVIALVGSFFLSHLRHINIAFTNASGLFKRDKYRPIIEALVNLVVSIILVIYLGIIGIFIGTIISNFVVLFWREGYLLHFKEFKRPKKLFKYYLAVGAFALFTVGVASGLYFITNLMPNNFWYLILKFFIVGIIPSLLLSLMTYRTKEFKYLSHIFLDLLKKIIKRKPPKMQTASGGEDKKLNDEETKKIKPTDEDKN